jgi:hypothetical protein
MKKNIRRLLKMGFIYIYSIITFIFIFVGYTATPTIILSIGLALIPVSLIIKEIFKK